MPQASPKPTATPVKADAQDAPVTDPNADIKEYVVTANAITYRVAEGRDGVRRFERGARLRLHSEEARVMDFVRSKSIALRSDNAPRSTAAQVFRAMGAGDDPAKPPEQEFLPMVPDKTVTAV